ncbi:MAG: YraN family protein, partial [Armatimonadetes bacterium]|nr:YraN family protein [Armatimonadota bacterium]
VLERNVRVGCWEIDIVAQEGDTLVFVEVKAGREEQALAPREKITRRKLETMSSAGEAYIRRHRLGDVKRRLDVAEVALDESGRPISMELFRGAFPAPHLNR